MAEKERTIKNKVAVILYATRNSIVHAKANFKPTENECPEKDLYHQYFHAEVVQGFDLLERQTPGNHAQIIREYVFRQITTAQTR